MEDDEDCYGFGALSDMFESEARGAGSPAPIKKLDLAALSKYWWSERRLHDFQRARRGASPSRRKQKEFQHIAAKFNGMRVDGGLGAAFVVAPLKDVTEQGGVLWIQSISSDSNALARRKKEFQDITNRQDLWKTPQGGTKTGTAVFLSMLDISSVEPTTMQNTVHGVKFHLHAGSTLELVFMPGPFFDANHRDEFLALYRARQDGDADTADANDGDADILDSERRASSSAASSRNSSPVAAVMAVTQRASPCSPPEAQDMDESYMSLCSDDEAADVAENTASKETYADEQVEVEQREPQVPLGEDCRELIRKYVSLNEASADAIAIAHELQTKTGYRVGPLSEDLPQFSANAIHRRKTLDCLSKSLERMNKDWKQIDQERETFTRVTSVKNDKDLFEYTDVETHQVVSSEVYKQRYLQFIAAQHQEPVLRMFPLRSTTDTSSLISSRAMMTRSEDASSSSADAALLQGFSSFLGVDVSSSGIIDREFFATLFERASNLPLPEAPAMVDNHMLQVARAKLWRRLKGVDAAVARAAPAKSRAAATRRDASSSARNGASSALATRQTKPEPFSPAHARRRTANRRRSLAQPSLEELQAIAEATAVSSPAKRKRPASQSESSPQRRRRSQGECDAIAQSHRLESVPQTHTTTVAAPSSAAPAETKQTSLRAMAICELCCDADADVQMKPCGHAVCRTCWMRLARPSSGANASPRHDQRQCPWDRETVTMAESIAVPSEAQR